jgi:hypothetical protein
MQYRKTEIPNMTDHWEYINHSQIHECTIGNGLRSFHFWENMFQIFGTVCTSRETMLLLYINAEICIMCGGYTAGSAGIIFSGVEKILCKARFSNTEL